MGNALNGIGIVCLTVGRLRMAVKILEKRLELACESGDLRGEGNSLNNLGRLYQDLKNYDSASNCYSRRLEIARSIGDRKGGANGLMNLATLCHEKGAKDGTRRVGWQ